jgi:hypothetical protein
VLIRFDNNRTKVELSCKINLGFLSMFSGLLSNPLRNGRPEALGRFSKEAE